MLPAVRSRRSAFTFWTGSFGDSSMSLENRAGEATLLPARDLIRDQLKEQADRVERPATAYLDCLDERSLAQEIVCHSAEAERTSEGRFPIGNVLWHVAEEELQHRGELHALLWRMDVDPPVASIEDWNASKASG